MKRKDKPDELLAYLEALAEQLGYMVRYDDLPGRGGFVQIGSSGQFILNRLQDREEKIELFCETFKKMDLQDMHLKPVVRKAIFGEEWER